MRVWNLLLLAPLLQDPGPTAGDAPDAAAAPVEEPAEDPIAARHRALAEAEERAAAGELEAARARLAEWMAPGLAEVLADEDARGRARVALRVAPLAARLSLTEAELDARRLAHDELAELLPPDDETLLTARMALGTAYYRSGDVRSAHAAYESVHAAWEETLADDHAKLLAARSNLALTRKALGDLEGALELEERVLAVYERDLPPEHRDVLVARLNLAATLEELGRLDRALALGEETLASLARTLPEDDPAVLTAKGNLAGTRRESGDLEGALALEEEVLAARERTLPPEHPSLLMAKASLAISRKALGDLAGALELEEEVHAVWSRTLPPDTPNLLALELNIGVSRLGLGDVSGAHAAFLRVHDVWSEQLPADHPALLTTKANLASTSKDLGDLEGGLALDLEVLAARERTLPPDHPDLLLIRVNVAAALASLGELERSLRLLEDVHAVWERTLPPWHQDLVRCRMTLASTRRRLGDVEGALRLDEQVLAALAERLPAEHPDLLRAKSSLAVTRRTMGDLDGALALDEEVLEVRERVLPDDHPDLLRAMESLAGTLLGRGEPERALSLYERVLDARRGALHDEHPDLLAAEANVAIALRATGALERALALQEQTLVRLERALPAEHPFVLTAKGNLALGRRRSGDAAGALALEEEVCAARARQLPAGHDERLAARANLGATRQALGDLEGLRAEALRLVDGVLAVARSASVEPPRRARAAALRELERLRWVALWSEVLREADGDGLEEELFAALEALRLVSAASSGTARAAAELPELAATLDELARVRRELAAASQGAPQEADGPDAWRAGLLALSERRDALERTVRARLAERGRAFEPPTAASVAAALPEDAVWVSYWFHGGLRRVEEPADGAPAREASALVVTPDARVRRIELGPAAPIEAAVAEWRAAVGSSLAARGVAVERDAAPADPERAGAALRALVLDPVLAAAPDATELRCVLDDALFLLPLDALPTGEGVVGDRLALRCATTARRPAARRAGSEAEATCLVLGGVDYAGDGAGAEHALGSGASPPLAHGTRGVAGASFAPLPAAAEEAAAVAAAFEATFAEKPEVLVGAEASKAALAESARAARYLHVATHGWFAPESAAASMLDATDDDARRRARETVVGFLPETLCGLALAGANGGPAGILTAEELATLDLTRCELAVLSACETNVGIRRAGQGIQSLQTALHAAGAGTAITSLWKVDDAATRELMERFYAYLWADGLTVGEALWRAKCDLREAGHPTRDWAGWVLSGAAE